MNRERQAAFPEGAGQGHTAQAHFHTLTEQVFRPSVLLVIALSLALFQWPARAQAIRVLVDGEPVTFDVPPVAIAGRVLVPLRGVFERLGADVEYRQDTRTIAVLRSGTLIQLHVGSREARINGRTTVLDVPPTVIRGRAMVPLRFVSEALGARVRYDAGARTVYISQTTSPSLTLAGWFHIIWNGGPRFILIDDQGRSFRLLVEEELFKPFGGALELQRKRIRVTGEAVTQPPGVIRVHSIRLEPESR